MTGGLALQPYNVDVAGDDTKRSHFEQDFNWRIDQDTDEFVIRITRKPEAAAAARKGQYTNVAVRIEGGLTEQPDGSVKFDGGIGDGSGVSTFGISFKISQEVEEETPEEEEPEEKEIEFFDHPEHKLLLDPENFYKNSYGATCDACMEPNLHKANWVYRCPESSCDYGVHAACAQLPLTIQHPEHPKHTVELLKLSRYDRKRCDPCQGSIPHGLHYHCEECGFDAHPVCPVEVQEEAEEWDPSKQQLPSTTQHPKHTVELPPGGGNWRDTECQGRVPHGLDYESCEGYDFNAQYPVCPVEVQEEDKEWYPSEQQLPSTTQHPKHTVELQPRGRNWRDTECQGRVPHGLDYKSCERYDFNAQYPVCPVQNWNRIQRQDPLLNRISQQYLANAQMIFQARGW